MWGRFCCLTLRSVTRSEAWRSVRVDMSSTILCNVGSEGKGVSDRPGVVELDESGGGDGGGGEDDEEAGNGGDGEDVAVASVRTRTDDRVLLLRVPA
jgi:hypothetical protein